MKIRLSEKAENGYQKLPTPLQQKADKQFRYLTTNYRHPSLRAKKMGGEEKYEARIDFHYRFTFLIIASNTILILSIGPHDSGLGKK